MHMHITQWKITHIKSVPLGSLESFWKEDSPWQLTSKFLFYTSAHLWPWSNCMMETCKLVWVHCCSAALGWSETHPSIKEIKLFFSQVTDSYKDKLRKRFLNRLFSVSARLMLFSSSILTLLLSSVVDPGLQGSAAAATNQVFCFWPHREAASQDQSVVLRF